MKRLYVIGNGFDLHHNLPTGLNNFRDYMKSNHALQYQNIDYFFSRYVPHIKHNDWNELETMLICTTELDAILEDAIESVETDTDKASFWNDIQYSANSIKADLTIMKESLDNWIAGINISDYNPKKYIQFDPDAIFLTFNYTETLQKLYGVLDTQVLHIHGSNIQEKVLGHNESYSDLPPNIMEDDWRVEEAKEILNHIPALFYKNSESIIESNRIFFDKISDCDEIIFMGWSLGLQDEMYMDEILSKIKNDSKINVVYFKDDDKKRYQTFFAKYSSNKYSVSYYTWETVNKLFKFLI